MVELQEEDRRSLTSAVLRTIRASEKLVAAALDGNWQFVVLSANELRWVNATLWDGNASLAGIQLGLHRAMLAAAEQGRALYELARSDRGYTVGLATLARGAVEALSRANWVLSSPSADQLLVRHASLEYADLRYPAQHKRHVHNVAGTHQVPVDAYRTHISETLREHGLALHKVGPAELATALLGEIYDKPAELYSGLSASAHGQSWATSNFFDAESRSLKRDDQMVIEYCAYVIETATHTSNRFASALYADFASVERWVSERDKSLLELDRLLGHR